MKLLFVLFFMGIFSFAPQAKAQVQEGPLQLKLSGYTAWYVAGAYNKRVPAGDKYNRFDVMGDAEIYFEGTATISDNFKIGVMAQLEGGTDDYSETWDEVYMFAQSQYGKLLLGDMRNVSYSMTVTAPSVSVMGAEWTYYTRLVNQPANLVFIDATDSKDVDSLSPKISYISPSINGLAFGLSFTTASNTRGHDASVLYPENDATGDFNIKYGGLALVRYDHAFSENTQVSASAYYGHYRPNDTTASHSEHDFGLGAKITTGPVTLGASYRRVLADSRSAFQSRQGYALDIGAVYDWDKYAVSANWYRSEARGDIDVKGNDRVNMYILAGKYRLGAGIEAFVDVGYVQFKDETGLSANENEGVGTAVGFNLAF